MAHEEFKQNILKRAKDALDKAVEDARMRRNEEDRKFIISKIGEDLGAMLFPLLEEIALNAKMSKDDIKEILTEIKSEFSKLEIKVPDIKLPTINIPQIKSPEVKIPEIKIPQIKIPPIHVPKPEVTVHVPEIKLPKIEIPKTTFPAFPAVMKALLEGVDMKHPLPVMQVDLDGNPYFASIQGGGSGGNIIRDILTPDGISLTKGGATAPTGEEFALYVRNIPTSTQTVSGTITGITNSIATSLIDSSGVQYSGSNPLPIVGPVVVTSITNTTAVVGNINSGAADDETPPVKVGGIARTANPTAVTAGNRVSATYDKLGRQVMIPLQIRDLISTARVSFSTGVETTLLAGVASTFLDCIMITAANNSTAAVNLDIRSATGAGIVASLSVPANATQGWAPEVPYPQNVTADTWTIQNSGTDVSGTTVVVTGLFVNNI